MGLRAEAYLRIGGMPALAVGEDHELARRLTAAGDLRVVRTTAVRVTTSARLVSRVRGGFADYLRGLGDPARHAGGPPGAARREALPPDRTC
jgi:hypothetical protein